LKGPTHLRRRNKRCSSESNHSFEY